MDLGELAAYEPRIFQKLFIEFRSEGSLDPLDYVKLVDFRLPREQGLAIHEFAHDAADGSDVNRFGVAAAPE